MAWLNLTLLCLTQEPPTPKPSPRCPLQPWDTLLPWGLLGKGHLYSKSSSRAGALPFILKPLAWPGEACAACQWAEGL